MDPIVIGGSYVFTRRPEYEGDPLDTQVLTVTDIDYGIVEAEDADGNDEQFRMVHRVREYHQLITRRQWTAHSTLTFTTPQVRMPVLNGPPSDYLRGMMNVEGGRRKRRVSRKKLSRKKSRKAKKSRKIRR